MIRPVPQRHVRKLVRHHSGKLRFIVGHLDRSAIDKNVSAGQGKGIDGLVIHTMKFEGVLHAASRELFDQPHSQLRQIGIDSGRMAKRQLFFCIRGSLLAQLDVLLRREHVPSRPKHGALRGGRRRE